MQINDFITLYKKEVVTKLTDYLKEDPKNKALHLRGIQGSLDAVLTAALHQSSGHLQLVVVENKEEAVAMYGDLSHLLPSCSVLRLPSLEEDKHKTIQQKRSAIIHAISESKAAPLVVTHIAALLEKILDPSLVATMSYKIQVAQTLSIQNLENMLKQKGFIKVDFVYQTSQFAIRGGIIDIYPVNQSFPYRIELWGDEVSSIRIFDPKDQKSFKQTNVATIVPNPETTTEKPLRYTSFSACLPVGSSIWLKNKAKILAQPSGLNTAPAPSHTLETIESFIASIVPFHQILFGSVPSLMGDNDLILDYDAEKQPLFQQNFNLLADDLHKRNQQNYDISITAASTGQLARLKTILENSAPTTTFIPLLVSLREGYIDHTAKIVCYSDHEIFNRYYRYQPPKPHTTTEALLADACRKLEIGDYVVHSDYGIGRFSGLHSLNIHTQKQEAIRLIYKNNDMVYVNVHELYKISKYTSKDGTTPHMHTLGTAAWKRKKTVLKNRSKILPKNSLHFMQNEKNERVCFWARYCTRCGTSLFFLP